MDNQTKTQGGKSIENQYEIENRNFDAAGDGVEPLRHRDCECR